METARALLLVAAALLATTTAVAETGPSAADDLRERARRLLREVPLVDGHNDLPWRLRDKVGGHLDRLDIADDTTALEEPFQTDLARLRAGGVGAQFWSVWVPADLAEPEAVVAVLEQIDLVRRMVERNPDALAMARTASDVERIHASGRIASMIGVEGGHCIASSLAVLRQLHALGAGYMTLTHSRNTPWADSCCEDPEVGGLTAFGSEVVGEMNRLGMLVDMSHVSPETMSDVLDVTRAPVIFSHSSTLSLTDHVRNVPDDVLERLPANGGMVMVTFVPSFVSEEARDWRAERAAERARLEARLPASSGKVDELMERWAEANPQPRASLAHVADHIDHVVETAGIDHVGIGSDYDGMGLPPTGLEDVASYPDLLAELLRRGYSDEDVRKVAGLNVLRVMRAAERVAAALRAEREPSSARIDELDAAGAGAGEADHP
jgi:membrane dipeptidase